MSEILYGRMCRTMKRHGKSGVEDIFLSAKDKRILSLAMKLTPERRQNVINRCKETCDEKGITLLVDTFMSPEQELLQELKVEYGIQRKSEENYKMLATIEQEKLYYKKLALKSLKNWKKFKTHTIKHSF